MSLWKRVTFNIEKWKPSQKEFFKLLSLVPFAEQQRILRFKKPVSKTESLIAQDNPNAKASLVGLLILRQVCKQKRQSSDTDFMTAFHRTSYGKPYLDFGSGPPAFSFNISHTEDRVVFVHEDQDTIGVDVMGKTIPRADTVTEKNDFFDTMQSCFTEAEWLQIHRSQTLSLKEAAFFRHWTLKEAYIKALGLGLSFDLQRVQFDCQLLPTGAFDFDTQKISVKVDGIIFNPCFLLLESLGDSHLVATCILPATDSACLQGHPYQPLPWHELTISDLL